MTRQPQLMQDVWTGPKAPIRIPKEFDRLYDLAYNLWWSWNPLAYDLWARIDARRWAVTRNPLSMLPVIEPETWEALSASSSFSELYGEVINRFDDYMGSDDTWYTRHHPGGFPGPIAYLCAEFGIHHSLQLYSGGLGILAGDHVKAASDLGLPLFGVGLFYRRGYFRQAIDPDGNQEHSYLPIEPARRPMRQILDTRTGRPLRISVDLPDREVHLGAWRVDVGRVPVMLLDTDVPENDPADRPITQILYVRGREMRFNQELLLGVGGARLIEAVGIEPSVWHVNEGHAAMSLLERLSGELQDEAPLEEAIAEVSRKTLFTLHTPVPAGNEVFDLGMATHYLHDRLPGVDDGMIADLSKAREESWNQFDLGALAIRLSSKTNGVSKRHGEIVSHDWGHLIGGAAEGITNGVHTQTWVGRNMARLFSKVIGDDWEDLLVEPDAWKAILDVDAKDLWEAHSAQKEIMLRQLRGRLRDQFARHGESPSRLRWIDDQMPADRLTIVFARRFATYKRAGLLFSDPGRARALLTNPERPVQVIFAGKAHPADREGQGLIRWVVEMGKSPDLQGRLFFIENYDMALAESLVAGADVWLNNPRPPKEASGTSGMKAAMNGALNLSVLDGWWLEGFNGANGWGFSEHSNSDAEDAGILYHLLESEVVPRYYERNQAGVPEAWVDMMKQAISSVTPAFSMQRTLVDYAEKAYLPLAASESARTPKEPVAKKPRTGRG